MTFVRTLLVAAALALPVATLSAISTSAPADAAPMRAKLKSAKAAHHAGYKSCGTYMYRKGGKCLDARAKPKK